MDDEIQLISDGAGVAVIGDSAAVERFLASEGLLPSTDLGLPKARRVLGVGSAAAQAGSEIAANSGRWVKLTEESAQMVKKYGLMESKTPGGREPRDGGQAGRHQVMASDRQGTWLDGSQPGAPGRRGRADGAVGDAASDGRDH